MPAQEPSGELNLHRRSIPLEPTPSWVKPLAVLITLGATLAGLIAIRGLFNPGYVMNFDHPMQQGIIKCFLDDPSLFVGRVWCSHLQAGIAPFQSYPILFYQLVIFLSVLVGLELAYKIGLLIVWFLLPSTLLFLLWRYNHPLAGAFAFALTLLTHGGQDVTGLEFFLIVGSGFNQLLGFSFFALTLHLAIGFFQAPTIRRLAFLSLSTALYFLAHPTTFLLFIPIIITLGVLHRQQARSHTALVLGYPLLVFFLSAYFIIPALMNLPSNEFSSLGGNVASPWQFVVEVFTKKMSPSLLATGILGLLLSALLFTKTLWAIPGIALGLLVAWSAHPLIAATHLFDFAQFGRTVGVMYHLLLIGSAILGETATLWAWHFTINRKLPRWQSFAAAGILVALFGAIIISEYQFTTYRLNDIVTASHPVFANSINLLKGFKLSSGRILFEETYGQTPYPSNLSSVWGIAPLYTSVDVVNPLLRFFRNPYGGSKDGALGPFVVTGLGTDEVRALMKWWNLAAVVAGSPYYNKTFGFLQMRALIPPFTVFVNNETPLQYFQIIDGTIHDSGYFRRRGWVNVTAANDAWMLFKVRYWGNWIATVDGKPAPVFRGDHDLMVVRVPSGNHLVRFTFAAQWWDLLGLALTLTGLFVVAAVSFYTPTPRS